MTKFPEKELTLGLISVISGLIALSTLVWVFIKYPSEKIIGERFVLDEISIVMGHFNFKPITIIVSSAFVCWVCALESLRFYLLRLPIIIKSLMFVFLVFSSFIFSYEIIWNFFAWSDAYILSEGKIHIDMIHHLSSQVNPTQPGPYNFAFKTKEFFLYFASSLYGLNFFHGMLPNNISHKKYSQKKK